jgi:hypothetical protein
LGAPDHPAVNLLPKVGRIWAILLARNCGGTSQGAGMAHQGLLRRFFAMVVATAAVSALSAACWFTWLEWDNESHVDSLSGAVSGPYQAWQVIGCAVSLLAIAAIATSLLPWIVPVVVMPVAFGAAMVFSITPEEMTARWQLGALLAVGEVFLGVLIVAGLSRRMSTIK